MGDNLPKTKEIYSKKMQISSISTGFIEVPTKISLNIYVQGCKLSCNGCHNPDLQSFSGGSTIFLKDFPKILEKRDLPTWICWLGGDAVYQPEGFLAFNEFFKTKGYKICLYTGNLFLKIKHLLKDVDMVVDGPWEGKKIDEEGTNQKIYIKNNNEWNEISFIELKNILKEMEN